MPADARLFFALWPDERVRSDIVAAIADLKSRGRVVASRNLHVTLVFLGSCDAPRRECVERAAAAVSADAFELTLTHAQWRRNRGMVWLGAADVPAALTALVGSLERELVVCSHVSEPRAYRAHVTVARDIRRFAREQRSIAPIRWPVSDFCLVSSTLTPSGSEYAVVGKWKLRANADWR